MSTQRLLTRRGRRASPWRYYVVAGDIAISRATQLSGNKRPRAVRKDQQSLLYLAVVVWKDWVPHL